VTCITHAMYNRLVLAFRPGMACAVSFGNYMAYLQRSWAGARLVPATWPAGKAAPMLHILQVQCSNHRIVRAFSW
jgi:hypothetical protein